MSAFFELRIYQVFPGKMMEWLELMENELFDRMLLIVRKD